MDSNDNQQTQILQNIWQEIKSLHQSFEGKLNQTNQKLDQTNQNLDETRGELKQEINETRRELKQEIRETNNRITRLEVKLSTEVIEVVGMLGETNRALQGWGGRLHAVEKKVAYLPK